MAAWYHAELGRVTALTQGAVVAQMCDCDYPISAERGLLPRLRVVLCLLIELLLDSSSNITKYGSPGRRRRGAD